MWYIVPQFKPSVLELLLEKLKWEEDVIQVYHMAKTKVNFRLDQETIEKIDTYISERFFKTQTDFYQEAVDLLIGAIESGKYDFKRRRYKITEDLEEYLNSEAGRNLLRKIRDEETAE
jgi:Arc/MetJ-type ribon-helix-helix transcriptional regulator